MIMPLTMPQDDEDFYNYYHSIVVLLHQMLSIDVDNFIN